MATANKRGAPALTAEQRKAEAVAARLKKKQDNRKKFDEARAPLKTLAKDIMAGVLDTKTDKRPNHQDMTEEQLAWFEDEVVRGASVAEMPDRRPDFPCEYQLWRGIADEQSTLAKIYARGKQLAVARIEEQIIKVAQTAQTGKLKTKRQVVTRDGEVIDVEEEREYEMLGQRALQVDALKWQLAHIRPKKHGRQPETGSGGKNEQLESLFQALMQGPAKED
jgi:hypothetical protein